MLLMLVNELCVEKSLYVMDIMLHDTSSNFIILVKFVCNIINDRSVFVELKGIFY